MFSEFNCERSVPVDGNADESDTEDGDNDDADANEDDDGDDEDEDDRDVDAADVKAIKPLKNKVNNVNVVACKTNLRICSKFEINFFDELFDLFVERKRADLIGSQ